MMFFYGKIPVLLSKDWPSAISHLISVHYGLRQTSTLIGPSGLTLLESSLMRTGRHLVEYIDSADIGFSTIGLNWHPQAYFFPREPLLHIHTLYPYVLNETSDEKKLK